MGVRIVSKPRPIKVGRSKSSKRNVMRDAGQDWRSATVKRTKSGKDVNGKNFQSYSDKYATAKREGKAYSDGRRSKGKSTGKVDLELGGTLLKDIKVDANNTRCKIYPTTHGNIGYYHNVGLGVPKREWWGTDKQQKAMIRQRINMAYKVQR
jgi:hypothetical protein